MSETKKSQGDSGDRVYQQAIGQFSYYHNEAYHYLDSAATCHKPDSVLDAVTQGYRTFSAPVHRASYPASEAASLAYETARASVAQYINAPAAQLVFTKSCTESINLVARAWAKPKIQAGQRIWVSRLEHNANYLPWYQLCRETGAELRIIDIDGAGHLQWQQAEIWDRKTFLIALTHCSNVLGGETPIHLICARAKQQGIYTLIDAAQSIAHKDLDVAQVGCDFLGFSAHKMYGPEGIGALYLHPARSEEMMPLLMGGGIVASFDEQHIAWRERPHCFEAGSPNLSGALGFAAAINFLKSFPKGAITRYVGSLGGQFRQALGQLPRVRLLPVAGGGELSAVIAFTVEGVHPHDVAQVAAEHGVAIRTGHHCSHILVNHLNRGALNRVSLGVYNRSEDIAPLIKALTVAIDRFA